MAEIRDYIPNRHVDRPIGFPSDDTQLAFWTLEQMLKDGGVRPEKVADCFCRRRIFGIGSTVREFLTAGKRECHGNDAASRRQGTGL